MKSVEPHNPQDYPHHECPSCFRGYVTITVEDDDGNETYEAVPCRNEGGR
jgi:hypothetical protein